MFCAKDEAWTRNLNQVYLHISGSSFLFSGDDMSESDQVWIRGFPSQTFFFRYIKYCWRNAMRSESKGPRRMSKKRSSLAVVPLSRCIGFLPWLLFLSFFPRPSHLLATLSPAVLWHSIQTFQLPEEPEKRSSFRFSYRSAGARREMWMISREDKRGKKPGK